MKPRFRMLKLIIACTIAVMMIVPAVAQGAQIEPYPETVTVRVGRAFQPDFKYHGGETLEDNTWMDTYKERLNVEIDNMWVVDISQEEAKMNAAIASGDYPDVFSIRPKDYAKYAASGVIADVTDLYDEYMTEDGWRAATADNGYSLDAMRIDGRLYGIPIVDNPLDMMSVLFLRQDWLEAVGLEAPETVADFEAVCEAFVNGDPDGNGRDDTYALALNTKNMSGDWGSVGTVFEMFGAHPLAPGYKENFSLIEGPDGDLVWGGETEGAKEALAFLQKAYQNRWIAQDFGTHDGSAATADFGQGKAGMFFAPMWGGWTAAEPTFTNFPEAHIVAAPIPGKDGIADAFYMSSLSWITVVSTKCENPEVLFKLFCLGKEMVAYQEDQEVFNRHNGDAVNYTGSRMSVIDPLMPMKNLDNFYKVSAACASGDTSELSVEQTRDFALIKANYLDATAPPTLENVADYATGFGLYNVFGQPDGGYAAVVKHLEADAFVYAGYGTAPTDAMAAVSATLSDLIETSVVKIIYGEESVDYWDTVVENWHALGGDTVLAEANAWYSSK